MKTQKERLEAEMLFVREGKSIVQIAAQLGLGIRTVKRWSSEGYWSQRRRARRLEVSRPALDVLKRQLELQIKQIGSDELANPDAIDALNKLNLTIEKMESRLDAIGPMLDAMGRFAQFVAARADADARAVIHTWMEKFLNEERRKNS